jgi:hypothetical protein
METAEQHICHCEEPARRDGAGQLQRFLKALDPTFAPVDGRSLEDLLVFAKRYSSQIRFHQFPNQQNDDLEKSWRDFFRHDLSVLASSIITVDLAQIKKDYDEINQHLNNLCDQTTPDNHAMLEAFKALFDPIMGIAKRIDRWYAVTLPNHLIRQDLDLLIQSFLAHHLAKGVHYAQTFAEVNKGKVLNLHLELLDNQHIWQIEGLNLDKITKPFEDDDSIYEGNSLAEQLRNASLFVEDIFQAFFQGISKIVSRGDDYLRNSLEEYPAHQPQMALFIAFLELFRLAQDQMNGLTEKHLQFYYRDVLRLQEKPAQPDKAFVVFELAKNVSEHHLAKQTALDAGKDKIGNPLQYGLTKDFVVHQAKVASLKTLYFLNFEGKTAPLPRPIANSLDGYGGKFTGKNKAWQTFGTLDIESLLKRAKGVQNICEAIDLKSFAEQNRNIGFKKHSVGFAIASPQLVLGGGKRLVKLSFENAKKIFGGKNTVNVQLTGEKGWIELEENAEIKELIGAMGSKFPDGNTIEKGYWFDGKTDLYVYLPIKEKAIISFNTKIHTEANFNTKYPVMQVLMRTIPANLEDWNSLEMDKMAIEVQVGSINPDTGLPINFDGVTKLLTHNDNGSVDNTRAFDPFGFYPSKDSAFLIGSEEIFNKPLKKLGIQLNNRENGLNSQHFEVSILQNQNWSSIGNYSRNDLRSVLKDDTKFTREDIIEVKSWSQGLEKGFIKLQHTDIPIPSPGLVPQSAVIIQPDIFQIAQSFKVSQLSLNYHSVLENLDPKIDQFFHIYPFGTTEISANKTDKIGVIETKKLLPNFTYESLSPDSFGKVFSNKKDKVSWTPKDGKNVLLNVYQKLTGEQDLRNQYTGKIQEQGHLFIGLEDLKPLESLSLLFQFAEGSANDEDHDPPKIHWSYLTNNEWRPLRDERITSDSTFGFRATGIMVFDIPADITDKNTLIATEKSTSWLCATVTKDSDRFPQLIDVVAQATEVQLIDNQNDSSHFDEALKADSISKLVVRTANIQSVKQPFASFEGKAPEVGRPFYTRVSERLRHKARAINAWDYEHIVLNQYPNVFKVKCVQHIDPNCLCRETEMSVAIRDNQDNPKTKETVCCGSQIAPGHVMIVPIPNLKNRVEVNPLKPKNSRRTLVSIEEYLKKRTSPFVHIHARNPEYEPILTMFKVQFYEGYDKGFYLKFLNDEIVKYLSPWAFNEDVDVSFDNKIYASSIINFIEERPYVDFITDFKMIHCKHNCCPESTIEKFKGDDIPDLQDCDEWEDFLKEKLTEDGDFVAIPATPRSILTSVNQHLISIYEAPVVLSPCEKIALGK